MNHAEAQKSKRLDFLERWVKTKYPQKVWRTPEFKRAIEDYCLMHYALSDSAAKNMAKILQLRLIANAPETIQESQPPPAPVEEEEGKNVLEIIQGYRSANPEEFKAPKTDFQVIQED